VGNGFESMIEGSPDCSSEYIRLESELGVERYEVIPWVAGGENEG